MTVSLRIFRMAVWRYFTIMFRYRLNFVFEFLTTAMWGFVFLLMALVASPATLEAATGSTNYAAYMLLGMVFQMFNSVAIYGGTDLLREELLTGQIDTTFSSPFSRYSYIIANMAALAVRSSIFFIAPFIIGLFLTIDTVSLGGLVMGLLAVVGSVLTLTQMGSIFAALVLRYQVVTAIYGLFDFGVLFLTGMFVPLQLLPVPLQVVGFVFFPQAVGMDLMRHYIMLTRTLLPVPAEWLFMLVQFLVFALVARWAVTGLERAARTQGLHFL